MDSDKRVGLGEASPATSAHAFWKDFDLEGLRATLDGQSLALVEAQETSIKSRKNLAERTKELRKKLPTELLKQVGPLVKAYQEEIDKLTTRAKAGEASFLELYQKLYDAPDPAPALAATAEAGSRAAAAEAAADRLARELADYKEESAALRNQDLTIRRLEEKVRSLEAKLAEKERQVKETEQSAAEELQEALMAEARIREERLAEELAQAQASVEAMQRLHQASQVQILSTQSRSEEEQSKLRSELELAMVEMERAQNRLALLEREHEALLEKQQQAASEAGSTAQEEPDRAGTEEALRQELYAQRELAGRLGTELRAVREEAAADSATAASKQEALRAQLQSQAGQVAALEAALRTRPTAEEMADLQGQVRLLQSLGYGDGGVGGKGGAPAVDDVAAALAERGRKLEHELTLARLASAEAQSTCAGLESQVAGLTEELAAAKELAARLEEDLVLAQRQTTPGVAAAGEGAPTQDQPTAASTLSTVPNDPSAEVPSMIALVSSQRDRFKGRVRELEEHLLTNTQLLTRARSEADALRSDNLVLAERLKYVQSYGKDKMPADVEVGSDAVGRYMKQYEDGVNPFQAFRAKERTAAARGMPLSDRAALRIGNAVAGSRVARSVLMGYTLLLHCVIFLMLAGTAHRDTAKLEASYEQAVAREVGGPLLNETAVDAALRVVDPVTGTGGRRLLAALLGGPWTND